MYIVPVEEMEFMKKSGTIEFIFRRSKTTRREMLCLVHRANFFLPYNLPCEVIYKYKGEAFADSQVLAQCKLSKATKYVVDGEDRNECYEIIIGDVEFNNPRGDFPADKKYFLLDAIVDRAIEVSRNDLAADMVLVDSKESLIADVGLDKGLQLSKLIIQGEERFRVRWVKEGKMKQRLAMVSLSAQDTIMKRFMTVT